MTAEYGRGRGRNQSEYDALMSKKIDADDADADADEIMKYFRWAIEHAKSGVLFVEFKKAYSGVHETRTHTWIRKHVRDGEYEATCQLTDALFESDTPPPPHSNDMIFDAVVQYCFTFFVHRDEKKVLDGM
jgi:hypothetical protein